MRENKSLDKRRVGNLSDYWDSHSLADVWDQTKPAKFELAVENEEDLSPAWRVEIVKRCKEIDEGVVKLIPVETVFHE